jgi:plastocyanin
VRTPIVLLFAILSTLGCGGGSDGPAPVEIGLAAAGTSPSTTTVSSGGTVRFVNHDAVDHQIASTDCPELGSPALAPGNAFIATLGAGPKTCTYRDALHPSVPAFEGSLTVAAPAGGGGGGGGGGY